MQTIQTFNPTGEELLGGLVFHREGGAAVALTYTERHLMAGQLLYLRAKMEHGGDEDRVFADLGSSLLAHLEPPYTQCTTTRALAAATVYTAGRLGKRPDVNCMSVRASGDQIGGYELSTHDPVDFVNDEIGDRNVAGTLAEVIGAMMQEVEAFWIHADAGEAFAPRLIAVTATGPALLICPDFDVDDRARIFADLKVKLRLLGATAYVYASEVWMGQRDSGVAPCEDPHRREAMLLCAADLTGDVDQVVLEMVRDASGRVVELVPIQGLGKGGQGTLAELLR